MIRIVAALCAVCLTVPAFAQTLPAAAPADAGAKPKKPKRICRNDTDTGSHMVTSTCHSAEEWAKIDGSLQQDSQQLQQDMRNASRGN